MSAHYVLNNDTIVSLATAPGKAAIAVIRVSGYDAIRISEELFRKPKKSNFSLLSQKSHSLHFGEIHSDTLVLDEVLLSLFFAPHSYTGENIVEISCHGSNFIQQQIINLYIKKGCRLANPGEYTFRAFKNGKLDLSQAEAVADLIASNSPSSHEVALKQMRGGFSDKIKSLRENLVNFSSLIELELDFSEEDVEFANRDDLKKLIIAIQNIVHKLIQSFELGNVIKNGVPVVIVGKPNAGKSTLLNALLNEERAIVSEIAGTTRDTIEDEITLGGVLFRFIDTAGIRASEDAIESQGISRTFSKIKDSAIVIYLFDVTEVTREELVQNAQKIKGEMVPNASLILLGNKIDADSQGFYIKEFEGLDVLFVSAKQKQKLEQLEAQLLKLFAAKTMNVPETVVINARHVESLSHCEIALTRIFEGLQSNVSGDLLAIDIRNTLYYLGLITGEVTSDDILGNIFSKFCIGK